MGAVRMRVQTADKNITHTTQDHQLMSSEVKNCVFVRKKKSMIKILFYFNWSLAKSPLSKTCLSLMKKSSWLNQERNMHRSNTTYNRKPSKKLVDFYEKTTEDWLFPCEEWIPPWKRLFNVLYMFILNIFFFFSYNGNVFFYFISLLMNYTNGHTADKHLSHTHHTGL